MPRLSAVFASLLAVAPVFGVPTGGFNAKMIEKRQEMASSGLTDIDILNFALTAEHLEATFYKQGLQMFPQQDFTALGVSQTDYNNLKQVATTEATHVTALTAAIKAAGATPVQQCSYKFGFTNAQGMIATANALEGVGISAYLGAAPLINSSMVLGTAATIATVEARHSAFLRLAGKMAPVPNAFDTPLGPRGVFTIAAQFIQSCPQGSNLNITPFPAIQVNNATGIKSGESLVLQNTQMPAGASTCGFMNQGMMMFTPLTNGACGVPTGLTGDAYMVVTNGQSTADSAVIAGPSLLTFS
ncbi:MAG: hypothetical protein M1820_007369 [Bogoriella megaspora]|nr:MAG: hypothetical protein M1820_007369 [Bogoriella megaspora]